jgi:cytochrome c biogenesis protein CcdA
MGILNRNPYPAGMYGMPRQRSNGARTFFLILGILFGLYFLNLSFGWIALPENFFGGVEKYINAIAGIIMIALGVMVAIRPRPY